MKIVKKIGQVAVTILVAYFIVRVLLKNWLAVRQSLSNLKVSDAVVSVLLMAISFLIMTYLWHLVIKKYNRHISFIQAWYIYMKTTIIRYIPGNIWGLAAKAYMLTKLGLNKSEAIFILIFESAILVLSGIITYFLTLAAMGSVLLNICLAIIAVLLGIFVGWPHLFLKFLRQFYKEINVRTLPIPFIMKLMAGYIFYWLISGFSFYFLAQSIDAMSSGRFLVLTGIFAISWVIGFLSLITPSGLGVREVSIIYFLGKIIASPVATVVAILARIVFILSELICFALSYLVSKIKTAPTSHPVVKV